MWAVTAAQVQAAQATAVAEFRRTTGALAGVWVWHFTDWTVITTQKQNCMTKHKTKRQLCEEKGDTFAEKGQEPGQIFALPSPSGVIWSLQGNGRLLHLSWVWVGKGIS